MARKFPPARDPRFHYEFWSGPTTAHTERLAGLYYVENHNGQCGYSELALDFKIAADLAISQYRKTELGNWTAPVAHLVRQTIELMLKALLEATLQKGNSAGEGLLYSHSLKDIWENCRDWLINSGYLIAEDARVEAGEWLITCLHEIDPSGDLFRFGISRRSAFGKQKSYDRVGINIDVLVSDFDTAFAFLNHWEAVPMREVMAQEMGWTNDPYFDPNDFPHKTN
jgi:hypothetical protein